MGGARRTAAAAPEKDPERGLTAAGRKASLLGTVRT